MKDYVNGIFFGAMSRYKLGRERGTHEYEAIRMAFFAMAHCKGYVKAIRNGNALVASQEWKLAELCCSEVAKLNIS